MTKCRTEVWEADPNYLLRRCEFIDREGKKVINLDVLGPDANPDTPDGLASLRLKVEFSHARVGYVEVEPPYRQRRWGTKLYEEARAMTCELGKPLSSDTTRSEFSEAFWRKQNEKGRARCVAGEGEYWNVPRRALDKSLQEGKISVSEYRRMTANLPDPEENEQGEKVWSCLRYELEGDPCIRQSLGEAPRRRRRRRVR